MHSKLYEEISKTPQYKKDYKKETQCLSTLSIKGFVVNNEKPQYLSLYKENYNTNRKYDFNDHGYCTRCKIYKNSKKLCDVRIGYESQEYHTHTIEELPKQFPFLKQRFFSYVDIDSCKKKISKKDRKALYFLLNDVRYNTQSARRYITEDVLEKSLFRDKKEELVKLKKKVINTNKSKNGK